MPLTRTPKARAMQKIGDATHPDLSNPKSVEKTKKELNLDVTAHNRKRKHGTDINTEVYQVRGDRRKFCAGYDNVEWD